MGRILAIEAKKEACGAATLYQFHSQPRQRDIFRFAGMQRKVSRAARQEADQRLYGAGGAGLVDRPNGTKTTPTSPTAHFCPLACYKNNHSFRHLVEQSLRRLRARQVFARSYIDQTMRRFENGEAESDRWLRGLISTDLALEVGHFG